METYLETVTLQGRTSSMPGIPPKDIRGDLVAETSALLFRAKRGDFSLAITYEQIKECYAYIANGSGFNAFLSAVFTLGMWPSNNCFVYLTYYSALHDQDITVAFLLGNKGNSPAFEKKATALAKAIWAARSEVLAAVRAGTIVHYREEEV